MSEEWRPLPGNWRRAELEAWAAADGGLRLAEKSKWAIQQYWRVGTITAEEAAEFGVRTDVTYCPYCDRELPDDETTGCPAHGRWWD